jgi:hypothetical protein
MSPKPLNMDSEIKSHIMATPSYEAISCLSVVEGREIEGREKGRLLKGGLIHGLCPQVRTLNKD